MATSRTATREIEGRDSVGLYLDEIARTPLLDAITEVELSKTIEAGLLAQRLLDEGVGADLGERWNAVVAAAVALSVTPVAFDVTHVERLRRAGLDDLAILDVINGAGFFNWANRLMLSLGEPAAMPAA